MLGVIIFDSTQRLPIYWSPRMTREFVDGVLDVVTADRSSQFAYVMGPPSLYRGSVSNQQNSTGNNDSSFFGGDNNNNSSDGNNQQQQRVSNALLHASLLSGVVESHHKIAQQHNSSADTGLIRPPHWPRLIRTGGTPLGRAAVAPTCPPVSRQVPSPAPNSLTKAQINTSKALNEGCVALSTNSPHSWLHPSVAPCSTEPVSDWILAHEPNHQVSQDELVRERLMMMNTRNGPGPRNENQQQNSNDNSATDNNNDELPSMFYFPWRIFGDSLGFVYCIFAPGPHVVMKTKLNQTEILEQLQHQQQQEMTMNKNEKNNDNNNSNVKTPNGKKMSRPGSKNDLSAMNSSPSSNNNKTNPNANHLTNQSFAGFFGPSSFLPPTAASPNKNNNFSGKVSSPHHNQNPVDYNSAGNTTATTSFLHEENMPAVKQSMANLFVLLCDSFKTTKSAEAPTSKNLMANMDQVHECVEICCPGNGRCMPLFDTQMARKLWKMRNEH